MPDTSLLAAALRGYEAQHAEVQARIAEIKRQLGTRGGGGATPRKRGPSSAAARKRIAAAQKARWAKYRKAKKA